PQNYRPVSITSHLVKVFERLVRDSVSDHLDRLELHSENQHGFRKGRSTMTQLLTHVDFVLNELCANREVDVVYLDFAKAFDKVDIEILLMKLKRYGIGGKLYDWIQAWIRGRQQCVVVEGVSSPWVDVLSGVAQGSVLGPLLFLIYVTDIQTRLNGTLGLSFADDTKLIRGISEVADHRSLQEDILRVTEWAIANNMVLHESKFQLLSFRLNRSAFISNLPFTSEYTSYTTSSGCAL
ncbi:MAG: RNA-directed DNA polymerase, partial [Pseudomonadales bacterium]